ncbi:MAG TPA: hypothetical protein PK317_05550 [Coprothermobacter proteolyticus]|nr:hypothetical protein [Coprothermobacter proteolyticus]
MTTVAVDKTAMTCDLQFTHSSGLKFKGFTKCKVVPKIISTSMFGAEKVIVGACGDADKMGVAWSWLEDPVGYGKLPKLKGVEFIALTSDGDILTSANLINWIKVDEPFYAIGSGSHFAIGAMSAGKTTVEAVRAAMKHDPATGMGVKTYKL